MSGEPEVTADCLSRVSGNLVTFYLLQHSVLVFVFCLFVFGCGVWRYINTKDLKFR